MDSFQWVLRNLSEYLLYKKTLGECLYILDYNLGQNISRLLHVLSKFLFTISEAQLAYYHEKVNMQVAIYEFLND